MLQKIKIFIRRILRIESVTRFTLNKKLKKTLPRIPTGKVLDIGSLDAPYRKLIPHTSYTTIDIDPKAKADYIGDVHNLPFKDSTYDTIVATELLEHCHTPEKAVNEMNRILKKNGICLASTRFIYYQHDQIEDYYRYAEPGLKHLFKNFTKVEIYPLGNSLGSSWDIIAQKLPFLMVFNKIITALVKDGGESPNGFLVIAKK